MPPLLGFGFGRVGGGGRGHQLRQRRVSFAGLSVLLPFSRLHLRWNARRFLKSCPPPLE